MSVAELKRQIVPGQKWRVTRHDQEQRIVGNVSSRLWPEQTTIEERTVVKPRTREIQWTGPDGKGRATEWPKAGELREVRDGYVHFCYGNGTEVTMERLAQ